MSTEYDHVVVAILQDMADAGRLQFPQAWTNGHGQQVKSWDPEADGCVLACYLDIFGLNGREPNPTVGWRRLKQMAQEPSGHVA